MLLLPALQKNSNLEHRVAGARRAGAPQRSRCGHARRSGNPHSSAGRAQTTGTRRRVLLLLIGTSPRRGAEAQCPLCSRGQERVPYDGGGRGVSGMHEPQARNYPENALFIALTSFSQLELRMSWYWQHVAAAGAHESWPAAKVVGKGEWAAGEV